jgi:transcription initiation factor TFIIB
MTTNGLESPDSDPEEDPDEVPEDAPALPDGTPDEPQEQEAAEPEEAPEGSPEVTECPECGGDLAEDAERGETVCSQCGLVVDDDAIDYGPEWRAFTPKESDEKARTGAPMTESLHDRGLSTVIGYGDRDAGGGEISSGLKHRLSRMRRLHRQASFRSGSERNLAQAITEIKRLAGCVDVSSDVSDQAIRLYREASDEDLIRGRSIDGMAAAALYTACRVNGIPRDLDAVANCSHVDRRTLHRTYRTLTHELDIKVPLFRATDHVPRFASSLDLPPELGARAQALVRRAEDEGLTSGRAPTSIAAAAVLAVAQESDDVEVTQKAVAEATSVSEVTLRHRLRELEPLLEDLDGLQEPPDRA